MKTLVLCLLVAGALASPSYPVKFHQLNNFKIVGGEDAKPGEFPYQISFQDLTYETPFPFCGGSIYSEHWVITAGHCVYGEDLDKPDYLRIVAGELDMSVEEGTEQHRALRKIVLHEEFNGFYLYNDISLLMLSEPLEFDDFVSAIELPKKGQESSGDCVITGWGALEEGGADPNILQKVSIPIMPDEDCRADYGESEITDSMICAGIPEGGKDSCQGDSGGPMACNNEDGSRYLAGVVSWGNGCARPKLPGVYTEVSYFVDWIEEHTQ